YGERKIKTDPGEDNFFVTEDIGASVGTFDDALKGRIAPFLKWDPAIAPAAPDGYIGDPNIDHQVTGGVNNYFAIIGPGVGANKLTDGTQDCGADAMAKTNAALGASATQADCIEQDLFSLMGKKAENAGVDIKRDTFSRDAAGNTSVDVLADSDADQTIVVQDPNAARRHTSGRLFPTTKMVQQGAKYYAHVVMAPGASFPNSTDNQVEVVNGTDGNPQASKDVTPVDEILEPTATYT